jgi:hypothetical protein
MAKKRKQPLELYLDEVLSQEEIDAVERLAAELGTDVAEAMGHAMVWFLRNQGAGDDLMDFPPCGTKRPGFFVVEEDEEDDDASGE